MKIKKLIIVLGCCIITLFSLVFVGCKRDTAKASIYSQSVLVELPAFAINIESRTGYMPTMYLGFDTDFYIYYLRSGTGFEPYYYKCYNGSNAEYFHYTYGKVSDNNVMSNIFADLASSSAGSSFSVISTYTYDDIISLTTHVNIKYLTGSLTYEFLDNNNNRIALISLLSLKYIDNTVENYNYSLSLVSTNILIDQEVLLNNAYNNGYNDAYNVGYHTGYNVGINDGYGATTPFDIVSNSISDLLDIELFGSFKISTLLYISFGMILLGIVIKVFLGG